MLRLSIFFMNDNEEKEIRMIHFNFLNELTNEEKEIRIII
jgi:hypothetical protein